LYNEKLTQKDSTYNKDKEIIVEEVCKNIDLVFLKFTSVQKIEYLQEYKDIEEER
jgi:hypothetical protein